MRSMDQRRERWGNVSDPFAEVVHRPDCACPAPRITTQVPSPPVGSDPVQLRAQPYPQRRSVNHDCDSSHLLIE